MKIKFCFIFIMLLFFSCGKDKVILLPEIEHAKITEVNDVSPAYLFYDETKEDSIELNRKNLISTTNWLVNVDKRLTLEQAIPKIKFLQDKKRNAQMHKNENAKNYYTCNDTSIKNLGFLEFTDVVYHLEDDKSNFSDIWKKNKIDIRFESNEKIKLSGIFEDFILIDSNIGSFKNDILNLPNYTNVEVVLNFHKKITFQDYISFKSLISDIKSDSIRIDNNEFIY